MALPEDHLAKFHKMVDAKEMWKAIKSRFGGNDKSKKMQKFQTLLSQLEIHGAGVSHEDANQKFLRSLPSSWSQVALIMRTKTGLDTLSFDDLYNNLRVFKRDVKVFLLHLFQNHNKKDLHHTLMKLFIPSLKINQVLLNHDCNDLEQINDDNLEEMDLKWQVAMISMRIKKFHKRTGRKLQDCRAKWNQDSRRRDVGYNGNKARDNSRRPTHQDDSKALVTIDGEDIDWSRHVKEDTQNFAIMAYSSNNLRSDNESVFMNKEHDLENTPVNNRYAKGMYAVPPPMIGNYIPSGPDVEIDYSKFTYGPKWTSVDEPDAKTCKNASCESDSSVETTTSMPDPVEDAPKVVSEPKVWTDAPIIEEYESYSDDDLVSNVPEEKEKPSFSFTDTAKHVKTSKEKVKETGTLNQYPKTEKQDRYSRIRKGMSYARKSCFVCGSSNHLIKDCDFHEKRMAKQAALTKSKEKGTSQQAHRQDDPHKALNDKGIIDSRCFRHMTGKKAHLADYQEFKGGFVAFRGSNGRITDKGKIKAGRKSNLGFLVGYSLNSKAFRVYNLETKRVEENLHVNFLENEPNVAGKGHAWMFDLDYLINSMNYEPVSLENQANKSASPKEANNSAGTQATDDQGTHSEEINLHDKHFVLSEKLEKLKRQEKEANDAVRKEASKDTQDANTNSINLLDAVSAPVSDVGPSRALNDAEPSYPDDSSMPHLEDIFANPTFASYMGFTVYQMDVKSAFLYGIINEEVYVTQPSGFVDPKFPNKVYKVMKALYGLHQDPRACVKTASTPIETQKPLVKDEEAADVDVHLYRSMIGSLMYLTASRKSTIGGCQFLGRRLISRQCKKQTIVATSTTEEQTALSKDFLNPLMADNLEKLYGIQLTMLHIKELASLRQTALSKDESNPLIVDISNESPVLGVNTPRCDEDSLELKELMVFFVQYVLRKMELELLLYVGNKMHKAFPLPVIKFPLAEEVPTVSVKDATARRNVKPLPGRLHYYAKSRRNCQRRKYIAKKRVTPIVDMADAALIKFNSDSGSDDDPYLTHLMPAGKCLLMMRMPMISSVIRTAGAFAAGVSILMLSSPWLTAEKELTHHEGTALNWLVQEQTTLGKDKSNPLIVGSLLKTTWSSIHHLLTHEVLTSPEQTATGKDVSNPLMAVMVCQKPLGYFSSPMIHVPRAELVFNPPGSSVRYALIASPTIRTSCIKYVGNKMHKAFPLPVIKFPLAEEVPTVSVKDATARRNVKPLPGRLHYYAKSRRNCQKFEQWQFRMQQYLQHEHYALWEVIKFRDYYEVSANDPSTTTTNTTSGEAGTNSGRTVTLTTEDMQKKKNDVKARTTLLLSLPDEHQLRFSQLQFMDVEVEQNDLNQKFLTSLALEWLMHTIVWRNRSDLDTMSLDDLYNHLKVYETEVQKKTEPNTQNMAFISLAKHSRGNDEVNTASSNVLIASANVATVSISQETACAYIASQSSGSQIKFEDINQIDEDDMEEMDIKWNMALLSMKDDNIWKKTGKKISI
nr:hypothetical protein [Tanacetum cinerariifolium]